MAGAGEPDASARVHAVVRGRVQGVSFRAFAWHHATALGLAGWVRNLPGEGAVEVVAQGRRAALEELLQHLRRGPALSRVTGLEVEWGAPEGAETRFEMRP